MEPFGYTRAYFPTNSTTLIEAARLLLHHGANPLRLPSNHHYSPFTYALQSGVPELLDALLTEPRPNDIRTTRGGTLLHLAVVLGRTNAVASLLTNGLGGQVRAGWRLPGDFGVQTIDAISVPQVGRTSSSATGRGIFAFAGFEGRAIAYNAFLDGNLWRASHHMSKFPLVADGKFGLVYSGKRFDVSLTQVIRSKEFVGQREIDAYGALALSVKWDHPATRR